MPTAGWKRDAEVGKPGPKDTILNARDVSRHLAWSVVREVGVIPT
jgi:hypothetical protein